ncbi:adenosylcobalamin-dependent ribonucleoside-diphosphate reductase, partial [Candidatus Woesearchaeota archaeon]|nr:adenosylcobalamin-dependent ribonucleoside-diphosphate reductase [Candidatus Woesearchaeota archaeon]
MALSKNALEVLKARYLLKDSKGKIIETPKQMFRRVAKSIAKIDNAKEEEFYQVMSNLEFLPNSPTLMNAGTELGQLSACFVLPIEDSLESIFDTLKSSALIHQSGGGTGFSFSRLRPKGDIVKSTKEVASGPVSFIDAYDKTTDVVKQGGKRRGANMGILNVDHPDIIEFIKAKEKGGLTNFNLSVGITDKFMNIVKEGKSYELVNPRNGKVVKKINARKIFDLIAETAWKTGDPGIVFLDEINRKHALKKLGRIESTNPCGEVPLLPNESCNLGSINLTKFISDRKINYEKLRKVIVTGVRFLDNVIDANKYPLKEIEKITKANRKIGLGVMGFADMLIMLGIRYDSKKALKIADELMKFISETAIMASVELAKRRGSFPNFRKSEWVKKYKAMRNGTVTTIAPTGSISIIANCSNGIEPLFATKFVRISLGKEFVYEHPLLKKYDKKLFVTAHDIKPEWHVKMQAVFQ